MKTVLVSVGALALGLSMVNGETLLSDTQNEYLFTSFVSAHKKKYETKHFFKKYNVFRKNLQHIIKHNNNSKARYTLGVNQFADKTAQEFATMHKFKPLFGSLHGAAAKLKQKVKAELPSEIDWRTVEVKGQPVVGPVADQQLCGSCWAFSLTGAVESKNVINGEQFVKLSEQELVDCSKENDGCEGGLMSLAYNYYKKNGAIGDKEYPYTGKAGVCIADKYPQALKKEQFVGFQPLEGKDALKTALVEQPISVALAAGSMDFQFYKSGVLDSKNCGTEVNHALVAVGYVTKAADAKTGTDGYYIIRNSWGPNWGDKGYINVASGANTCGMESHAFNIQPLLK